MGRISDQPLLGREQLEGDTKNGGIVLIGSHVKKTTDQLKCLKELDGQADFMEFQVNTVFEENGLEKEVERKVKAAEEKILSGRTVVIYTSRQLLAPENMTPEEKLQISVKISNAVTSIIGKLSSPVIHTGIPFFTCPITRAFFTRSAFVPTSDEVIPPFAMIAGLRLREWQISIT